ncbi:MAG: carbamoyl-phosphate synthase large subunit [Kiritimatiellia bacterium]
MPKRNDIEKILVIGSGPIVIGQACEFDYSGTQALKALKEEGYKVILVNSNPATIMTDPEMAWKVFIEPLTVEYISDIIRREKPDALLPTLGGQTALNLALELAESGVLAECGVEMIGAGVDSIRKAESRDLFKQSMISIGAAVPRSGIARSMAEAISVAEQIGFPLIIRPAFTLGGTGGAVVNVAADYPSVAETALAASPVHEILVEESLVGWKEFEMEVMRDRLDNCVVVCAIENLDPMGVHTGDSITVAPAQTLTDKEYQKLRDLSFAVMRAMGVDTGGSNIQFAVSPRDDTVYVIEMNPRVSRSSALASKATGFPIAKIAAKLAVGYTLDEIPNDITRKTPACFEPVLDYVVTKLPRFAFEKFKGADQTLGSSMRSVGEVMAMGRSFPESLQKALRGLEVGRSGLGADGKGQEDRLQNILRNSSPESPDWIAFLDETKHKLSVPNCDRIFNIRYGLLLGLSVDDIHKLSGIDRWFLYQIQEIIQIERRLRAEPLTPALLRLSKKFGFSDVQIAYLTENSETAIFEMRRREKIMAVWKAVDTCSAEFESTTPYFYSCYDDEDEVPADDKDIRKVLILGGGPNRIGQGIEFDYCICHASAALRADGYFPIIMNSNPETVSTDYDTSDRLYFDPLTPEVVLQVIEKEKPLGVIVQLGGQTPLNLLNAIKDHVPVLGTSPDAIDCAEDRERFSALLKEMGIPHPAWGAAKSLPEALRIASGIGYPVMLRPSYVLGGRAMEIAFSDEDVTKYLQTAAEVNPGAPVLIDRYLENALEVDVDCLADGEDVFILPLMEHIERAGIHSGDSACVTPPVTLSAKIETAIREAIRAIALRLQVKGLMNVQCAVKNGTAYILEVNPRASRTVPFISKAVGLPVARAATQIMMGKKLKELQLHCEEKDYCVKEVVLPFLRFAGVDPVLGPEMKSTGEVMGRAKSFPEAYYKAQVAAGCRIPLSGSILISLNRSSKEDEDALLPLMRAYALRYKIYATSGTARFLQAHGVPATPVAKIGNGNFDVGKLIKGRQVDLILNTPTGKRAMSDGYWIRRWAYENQVPLLTTLSAAKALIG